MDQRSTDLTGNRQPFGEPHNKSDDLCGDGQKGDTNLEGWRYGVSTQTGVRGTEVYRSEWHQWDPRRIYIYYYFVVGGSHLKQPKPFTTLEY